MRVQRCALLSLCGAALATIIASPAIGQRPKAIGRSSRAADTVTVAAGAHYHAGAIHRFFLGGAYRDLWTARIRVPVLPIDSYDGGLRPLKENGGVQTKSLRFVGHDGTEFVFRTVDKFGVELPKMWRGSVVEGAALDMISNSNPAAALVAAPILDAAGVLHVTPTFVVMPDSPGLG
jgi:hypothetical protein